MDFLGYVAFYLVTAALSYALQRRQAGRRSMPEAPQAGEMEPPTAKVAGAIPVVYGMVWVTPNTAWYGDLRTEPIKQCTGGECMVTGHRYLGGVHHVLCHGPVDAVLELQADSRTAWLGTAVDGIYHVNVPGLFGGDDGQGGIDGWWACCLGTPTQPPNSYLEAQLGSQTWVGIALEIRVESGVWSGVNATVMGGLAGALKHETVTLSDAAWHALPGTWDRLRQIALVAGAPKGDVVVRRADTQEEIGRMPTDAWVVQLDWYVPPTLVVTPAVVPAFRGVVSAVFSQTLWSANSAHWPNLRWKVQRCKQWDERTGAWSTWMTGHRCVNGGMNAAHILRELLISPTIGLGYGPETVDDAAFEAAAMTLYAEGFGLFLVWDSGSVADFAQTVLDHIDGRLYVHPVTALWTLDLIRGDYVREDLPVLDATNVVSVERYERIGWDETVNEVVVTYIDHYTGKETRVTAQNAANIAIQGGVVSVTRDYPGLGHRAMAERVAARDLRVLSRPLAVARLRISRVGWDWVPGQPLRWHWPEYGIEDAVYRVAAIDYGTPTDRHIHVELIEDAWGLADNAYSAYSAADMALSSDSISEPMPCTAFEALEAPYREVVRHLPAADQATLSAGAGYGLIVARRPHADHVDFRARATHAASTTSYYGGGIGVVNGPTYAQGDFAPYARTVRIVRPDETVIEYLDAVDMEAAAAGSLAAIGGELVAILEAGDGWLRVSRGVLDTTPAEHPGGTAVWCLGAPYRALDDVPRANGATAYYSILSRTGLGELPVSDAPNTYLTFAGRPSRPYPPGRVRINSESWPTDLGECGDLTITWAHRDRTQQLGAYVEQDAPSIGPETGTTYSIAIYQDGTELLGHSWTGLTGTTQTYTAAQMISDFGIPPGNTQDVALRIELWSVRDGTESWQRQIRRVSVTASNP